MDIREITVARSYKMNLGNYENVDVSVSMRAEIDELDDCPNAANELANKVEYAALQQIMSVYRARGKKVTEAEARRRHGIG